MGKKKKVTVGYRYYFGFFSGICRGAVDSLVTIKVGDEIAEHNDDGLLEGTGEIYINKPSLFGGDKKEGGIQGIFKWFTGKADQVCDPAVQSLLGGGAQPGFRGVTTFFYDGLTSAMNPYPKPWSVRVRRALSGWMNDAPWYPEKAIIELTDLNGKRIRAMNPAHIIYQLCTDKIFARGMETTVIHEASFRQAADTLFDEKLGLCMKWSRTDSVKQFRQSVIDHINAVVYIDRGTTGDTGGKIVLKLIRNDYIPSALPVFTYDTGLLEIQEAANASLAGSINEVVVKGVDPVTNNPIPGRAKNTSQIRANGGVVNTQTKDYPGLPTVDLCNRVAQRDLRIHSQGLRRFRLTLDRRAWRIHPGQVFRISEPSRGIYDMVLRAGSINYGSLQDGKISIIAVQDVFSFPLQSFTGVVPPTWSKPSAEPILKRRRVFEVPYVILAGTLDRADFNAIEFDDGYLGVVVEKPNSQHGGYELAVRDGLPQSDDFPGED